MNLTCKSYKSRQLDV